MQRTYEELLEELKDIVRKIEEGNISLDESITLYERGARLIRECEAVLEDAELRIHEIGEG
jgi:exodeoxyribonuclease VII small subunit